MVCYARGRVLGCLEDNIQYISIKKMVVHYLRHY